MVRNQRVPSENPKESSEPRADRTLTAIRVALRGRWWWRFLSTDLDLDPRPLDKMPKPHYEDSEVDICPDAHTAHFVTPELGQVFVSELSTWSFLYVL